MLHGRDAEIAGIERALAAARSGRSAVVTFVGEAGIGKTSLLEYAVEHADGFRVLRCDGVESEAELPFAALHQLLRPVLDRIDALPGPQAAALRGAFGLAEASTADRFLVGLATLTLLADAAGERPVLCVLDDAQWLDRESAEALLFASRRLFAEGVVVMGATRDRTAACLDIQPLGAVVLSGLEPDAAGALLDERAVDLAPDVRDRLLVEARGNPLALVELSAAVRADGDRPLVGPLGAATSPGASRVQDGFWRQVEALPAASRTALLVAAADDTGSAGVVVAAAERLGATLTDLAPAERAGLIRLEGPAVVFRHPLIRSVTYTRATASDRSAAHRALAAEFERDGQLDRRAWHRAAATTGPDDEVAGDLESVADRAKLRGGFAASSAAYERAARLSTCPADRVRRLAAAAFDARESGQLARAASLAEEAARLPSDPGTATRLAQVRARIEFEHGRPGRAAERLVRAGAAVAGSEPELAGKLLAEAVRMAYFADRTPELDRAPTVIESLDLPDDHALRPVLDTAAVAGRLLAGAPPEQLPSLHRVVRPLRPERLEGSVAGQAVSLWNLVGMDTESYEMTTAMLAEFRARGHIGALPHLLLLNAEAALFLGRLREALSAGTEGLRIAADTAQEHSAANLRSLVARVVAMTGDEERCVALAEESIRYGTAHQTGAHVAMAHLALCVLDLGMARYEAAFERLANLGPGLDRHLVIRLLAPQEHIEAAVRVGRPDIGAKLLPPYETWTSRHTENLTSRAVVQRCRALLSDGDAADEHYRAALRLHRRGGSALAQARTELVYGEWLRRRRRRTEARAQLRAALHTFETVGAASWAERARTELRAAGESVSSAEDRPELLTRLTPQELQVARLAATGLTNRDIGAQLFLSPRTVGYHLYKVFPKLGISTRADLARMNLG
ncbi:MAG TPA: AAA family ATPase [Streptosporangiales bacterium]